MTLTELLKKALDLRKTYYSDTVSCFHWDYKHIADLLSIDHPNIPHNILEHFIAKHSNQWFEIMKDLEEIDVKDVVVELREFSTSEIFNQDIMDIAPFSGYGDYRKPTDIKYTKDDSYFIGLVKGTWDYPIVAWEQNGKLHIIDGTNRFRRFYLYNQMGFDHIKDKHLVYVMHPK